MYLGSLLLYGSLGSLLLYGSQRFPSGFGLQTPLLQTPHSPQRLPSSSGEHSSFVAALAYSLVRTSVPSLLAASSPAVPLLAASSPAVPLLAASSLAVPFPECSQPDSGSSPTTTLPAKALSTFRRETRVLARARASSSNRSWFRRDDPPTL